MPEISIRPATNADAKDILRLITELADYEKAAHEVKATQLDVENTLFGTSPAAHALVGEVERNIMAIGIYFFSYSTWLGRAGVFLEDLYVTPRYRGFGAGKAMLQHLAKIALENDCGRLEWNVLNWNTPAIEFYESIGAIPQSEWTGYRLTNDALKTLADNE